MKFADEHVPVMAFLHGASLLNMKKVEEGMHA